MRNLTTAQEAFVAILYVTVKTASVFMLCAGVGVMTLRCGIEGPCYVNNPIPNKCSVKIISLQSTILPDVSRDVSRMYRYKGPDTQIYSAGINTSPFPSQFPLLSTLRPLNI
ncbi:hypothetical protein J6590_100918, partial [Homalodisca vitripennis]